MIKNNVSTAGNCIGDTTVIHSNCKNVVVQDKGLVCGLLMSGCITITVGNQNDLIVINVILVSLLTFLVLSVGIGLVSSSLPAS